MFPSGASPNPALLMFSNYAVAAAAWSTVVTTQTNQVTVTRTDDDNTADVIIMGYEDPNPGATGSDGNCGNSIACTKPAGTYPHIGDGQVFLIGALAVAVFRLKGQPKRDGSIIRPGPARPVNLLSNKGCDS